jgi:hypothetical protein
MGLPCEFQVNGPCQGRGRRSRSWTLPRPWRPSPTARACPRQLSALSVSHCKSGLYGAVVWARRALNIQKRRFPARAVWVDGVAVVARCWDGDISRAHYRHMEGALAAAEQLVALGGWRGSCSSGWPGDQGGYDPPPPPPLAAPNRALQPLLTSSGPTFQSYEFKTCFQHEKFDRV